MQALLSTWPSRNEFFLVPNLDCDLGVRSRNSCFKGQNLDLRCKLLSKHSTHIFCEPKRGSLGASFALTWVLEEKATGNRVRKENLVSLDGASVESGHGNSSFVPLEEEVYSSLIRAFGKDKRLDSAVENFQKGEIGKDVDKGWDNEYAKLENFTIQICR
ncbi:hypothetical protein ACH5RR_014497 [Cinchona calisaya]|uniref:Uncharacterized protein n=1 Tax=Cinchona calisaya TaxID=153742 RepID=A0ABD3A6G0_9GENT